MTQKHTPVPWTYDETSGTVIKGDLLIHENTDWDDGRTDEELAANARFIVQACNSFDDLLEACAAWLAKVNDDGYGNCCGCDYENVADQTRAAIARATSPQALGQGRGER